MDTGSGAPVAPVAADSGVSMDKGVRIDRWLWAARFFKTRGRAHAAVKGGKVDINGNKCKPARLVRPGDGLRISRGDTVFEVEVLGVGERRGPASAAQALYVESETSRRRRAELAERRKLEQVPGQAPPRRPDKRERRRIRSFTRAE